MWMLGKVRITTQSEGSKTFGDCQKQTKYFTFCWNSREKLRMETITGSDHTKLRLFSFNIFIITISMVMLAVSSSPAYSGDFEVDDEIDFDALESLPLDTQCVLIVPEYSENGPVRRKRSYDNKFKFGILGLANVDLITTILDSKSRQKNIRPAPRPKADRRLMELMTKNGR